ncbi:putative short chain dehydrogenase reductase family protein [Lyophyllum shimeji]|uniref:Short chain dehydrogenase reductase family protein n=1 Tax=Lyophyllum shimeji TaxID=47721 RepID=A0A9P3PM32_LYOSH|nr:putative short chain dehydrogenase reductase family protein [Lyophyllum shimeji]
MVLKILGAAFSAFFPTAYTVHIVVGIITVLVFRAFSQGRRTNRERDLHARKILVTGGFTPIGLTILQCLAQRGAHIIALSPHSVDSPEVTVIISLLRTTFSNEEIYAEQCDLASPSSIRSFCTRFLTGKDQRIDAIIFAHEYQHIGTASFISGTRTAETDTAKRESSSLATFLMTTLLLPALLVAPVERDIRLIAVVNPFYAAAAGRTSTIPFPSRSTTPPSNAIFLQEGVRSLRTSIFTRHLQRILDALPNAQVPQTDEGSSTIPVVSPKTQRSNIVAVSVSPGISRADTIAPLLNADWTSPSGFSTTGVILYLLLQPLLRIFAKSPMASVQTVLHALFLPTPFRILRTKAASDKPNSSKGGPIESSVTDMPEEVLKPGALYAECAVVRVKVPPPSDPQASEKSQGNGKAKAREVLEIADDGEFGGEVMGRLVWEAYEDALKAWEAANPSEEKRFDIVTTICLFDLADRCTRVHKGLQCKVT